MEKQKVLSAYSKQSKDVGEAEGVILQSLLWFELQTKTSYKPLCKIPELQQSTDSLKKKKLKVSHGMEIACHVKTIPFQKMKVI